MIAYLLGLATLPALYVAMLALDSLIGWFRQWRWQVCGICEKRFGWGPRTVLIRLHCRHAHGLAFTLRGRIRRRQWWGLSQWYAHEQAGVTAEEWQASVAAHRAAAS